MKLFKKTKTQPEQDLSEVRGITIAVFYGSVADYEKSKGYGVEIVGVGATKEELTGVEALVNAREIPIRHNGVIYKTFQGIAVRKKKDDTPCLDDTTAIIDDIVAKIEAKPKGKLSPKNILSKIVYSKSELQAYHNLKEENTYKLGGK